MSALDGEFRDVDLSNEALEKLKECLVDLSKEQLPQIKDINLIAGIHTCALFRFLLEMLFHKIEAEKKYDGPRVHNEIEFLATPEAVFAAVEELIELIQLLLSKSDKKSAYSIQIIRKERDRDSTHEAPL